MKVSVNILTKNRASLLKEAILSVEKQSFKDYEIIVVNDGSSDKTKEVLQGCNDARIKVITHEASKGITKSRQEALEKSSGEYIAILDDDDEWLDADKLKKQVAYLESYPECVVVGGGRVNIISNSKFPIFKQTLNSNLQNIKFRPETDSQIRSTMLFRNNFFTSTVMFRREGALKAGGFIFDGTDMVEDYDLWLRLGKIGQFYNFQQVFTAYRLPNYNKARFKEFLGKQLHLIKREQKFYPMYYLASAILRFRLYL